MKMCAALARHGHDVELVSKRCAGRSEPGVADDFSFYGVEPGFRVTKVSRPDGLGGGLVYALGVAWLVWRRRGLTDLFYCRDLWGAWVAAALGLPVVFEAHGPPAGAMSRRLFRGLVRGRSFRRLVVISQALRELVAEMSLTPPRAHTVVAHDAADPAPEGAPPMAGGIRSRRFRAGYVGHLFPGRGIELIAELARRMPAVEFVVVGGRERELGEWRSREHPANLVFRGFLPPGQVRTVFPEFDCLLMPYQRVVGVQSGRADTARYMSPLKLFEFMSTGLPIVASDLPVLREVLRDAENALLVPPDDAGAWERAIQRVKHDEGFAAALGACALREFLGGYTWDARSRLVLGGLAPAGGVA
jgi:glycosyltransferase involved in cell wall biosynthesis